MALQELSLRPLTRPLFNLHKKIIKTNVICKSLCINWFFKSILNKLIEWTKMGYWPMHLYIHTLYTEPAQCISKLSLLTNSVENTEQLWNIKSTERVFIFFFFYFLSSSFSGSAPAKVWCAKGFKLIAFVGANSVWRFCGTNQGCVSQNHH